MTISRTAHDSLKQDIFERAIDSWLETYTATPQLHSKNHFVDDVRTNIPQDVLNNKGWQSIITSTKAGSDEDLIYLKLAEISTAIVNAAKKIDPSFRTTNFLPGTNQQTNGCQLDIRVLPRKLHISCYTIGEYDVPSDTPIVRPLAQSPRGATQQPTADHELAQDTRRIVAIAPSRAHGCVKFDEFKICDGATEIMHKDPRRRFIFAFIVKGDMVSLWNFNRGHVCRSEPFKLHEVRLLQCFTSPRNHSLIRFLLFLNSATAEQLGYDPTITRHLVDSFEGNILISYEYIVEGKSYLTEGNPISEFATYDLLSQATRVWEVREILSGKGEKPLKLSDSCYALKDTWQYSDRRLERDIQKDIFNELKDIDDKGNTNHATEAKNYFMTIMHDWRVESNGISDTSFELPTGHQNTSFTCIEQNLAKTLAAGSQRSSTLARDSTCHSHSAPNSTSHPDLKHHTRSHVRTVYIEICYSIYELRDYVTMLQALKDIVTGLKYLRMAGFVHRDISAGNCLWSLEENCQGGKISDLEYARRYDELEHPPSWLLSIKIMLEDIELPCLPGSWGGIGGVAHYFPTDQCHLFPPPAPEGFSGGVFAVSQSKDHNPFINSGPDSLPDNTPPFHFNFYHDLESVFWIYVWFLHHFLPTEVFDKSKSLDPIDESVDATIHHGLGGSQARTRILTHDREVRTMSEMLRKFYSNMWPMLSALSIAGCLNKSYSALEMTQPVTLNGEPRYWNPEYFTDEPYEDIRAKFLNILGPIETFMGGSIPATLLNLRKGQRSHTQAGVKAKRARVALSSLR
ncbi:hypothetical protein DXG01_010966 [Tephrocybe rancida]|nr:hypothetical protein DXG01_010966 [Tephrocybe rancida]